MRHKEKVYSYDIASFYTAKYFRYYSFYRSEEYGFYFLTSNSLENLKSALKKKLPLKETDKFEICSFYENGKYFKCHLESEKPILITTYKPKGCLI